MRNFEIKVQVNNFDTIKSRLSFAREVGLLKQKDTYFFLGEKKLKLREEGEKAELIFYNRPKIEGSRESNYIRFTTPIFLKNFLRLFFSEKVVVSKERILLLYKHTRIHLDKVNKLGKFIELETVFNNQSSNVDYISEHDEVKQKLGLGTFKVVSGSYSDLLLEKQ